MAEDPTTSDDTLHNWVNSLLTDGRDRRRAHEAQWWENIATYAGDLWVDFDVHKNRFREVAKPDHKVRIAINLAQPVVRTEYAKLVKNKPIVDCVARSNDKSDLNAADVGDKILNHYAEKEFHLPRVRRRALWWVLVTGLGGVFVDYDDNALGEQEILVDGQGNPIFDPRYISAVQKHYRDKKKKPKTMKLPQGELRVMPLSPFQILWDYSCIFFEDAMWCMVSEVYDTNEVKRRWDKEVSGDSTMTAGPVEQRLMNRFDLSGQMTIKPPSSQDLIEVHRLFVKPGHRYFPNGAEIVFTTDEMLAEYDFPYEHGDLPVSLMGHVPFEVSQYPMSVLSQVKGPVLELSKTHSQILDNRNVMGNPPWLIPDQANMKTEIVNRPGLRIRYTAVPGIPEPHPIEMPEVPGYIQNIIPTMKEHILEIAGQGETSQGRVPAGARSGVAIAYLQEEDDTRLGPTVQEYEEMTERYSWQIIQVIAQNYNAPRTIQIYRKHSEPEVFDFQGTVLGGVAGINVQAGSALPRSKAAKQQFMFDLWDRGLEQDPRKVRQMLELNEGDPDEWEVDIQQAERENRKLMAGQDPGVQEWYNHQAHHYVHRRYMKSAEFESLNPQIQAVFLQHDAEHARFELEQQQQQQMQQMLGGAQGQNGNAPAPPQGPQADQVANGQNNSQGPTPPFAAQDDLSSLIDAQPQ